jgi:hypothetical protein
MVYVWFIVFNATFNDISVFLLSIWMQENIDYCIISTCIDTDRININKQQNDYTSLK